MKAYSLGDHNPQKLKSPFRTKIYLVKATVNVSIVKQIIFHRNQVLKFYVMRSERGDFNFCWLWSQGCKLPCCGSGQVVLVLLFQLYSHCLWPRTKLYLSKLFTQAQMFGISMKNASLGVRSLCLCACCGVTSEYISPQKVHWWAVFFRVNNSTIS